MAGNYIIYERYGGAAGKRGSGDTFNRFQVRDVKV